MKNVVEFFNIFLTISIAFRGKPRSSMRTSNLAWSMDLKAFWKSMYVRYISLLVSRASSRVMVIICIYLEVFHCGWKLFWLKCNSLYFSP